MDDLCVFICRFFKTSSCNFITIIIYNFENRIKNKKWKWNHKIQTQNTFPTCAQELINSIIEYQIIFFLSVRLCSPKVFFLCFYMKPDAILTCLIRQMNKVAIGLCFGFVLCIWRRKCLHRKIKLTLIGF